MCLKPRRKIIICPEVKAYNESRLTYRIQAFQCGDTAYTQKMQKVQRYYEPDLPSCVIEIIAFLLCHH